MNALNDAGLPVTHADPGFSDPIDSFETLWAAGAAASLNNYGALDDVSADIDPGLAQMWDTGAGASATEYLAARNTCVQLGVTMGHSTSCTTCSSHRLSRSPPSRWAPTFHRTPACAGGRSGPHSPTRSI